MTSFYVYEKQYEPKKGAVGMREMKFRAWDKEEDEMYSDVSILDDTWDMLNEFLKHSYELVLMQYTGLKDKNGVEIYEGDIVEITGASGPVKKLIKFEEGTFHFGYIRDGMSDYTDMVVVGNIHDNPELLEVTN